MARSTRSLVAVILYLFAGFVAINNLVLGSVPGDWLLPVLVFIAGLVLSLYPGQDTEAPAHEAAPLAAPEPMPTLAAAAQPKPIPVPEPVAPPAPEPAEPPAASQPAVEVRESVPEIKAAGETEAVPPAVVEQHPATSAPVIDASAAASAKPDDLTIINGIGPKIQSALRTAGYDTFARIAASNGDELRAVIEAAGMRLAPTIDTWPEQARALMK